MEIRVLIVGGVLILAGCVTGGASMRIDGSSQETTSRSLKQMSEPLSSYESCRLQAAILRIQLGDASTWKAADAEQKDKTDPLGVMIDGMTLQQIIELSRRYPDKAGSSCNN